MAQLIEKDEGTAGRRVVPFHVFLSNGTAPDTGVSNDSVVMGINSTATIVPNVLVVAHGAAQGQYYVTLNQSDVSVLGTHPLYYTQGDFPQHVATVQVVNNNPFSTLSSAVSSFFASLLSYHMGNARLFQDMFHAVRNKVDATSSVGTVYKTDDSTSAWTFSLATSGSPIVKVDPAT